MNQHFYLQHSLVTMCDPRMKNLLAREGLKGIGAYWVILEKLELLPEPCAPLEYLRPFCKSLGISFAYIKKIIVEYQLFTMDEEGCFMPEELNPICNKEKKAANYAPINVDSKIKNEKKHRKTAKKTSKTVDLDAKIVEKRQKIAEKSAKKAREIQAKKHIKRLNNTFLAQNNKYNNKEIIKDIIITTAEEEKKEKEKTAAAVAILLKPETCGKGQLLYRLCPPDTSGYSAHFAPPQCLVQPSTHKKQPFGTNCEMGGASPGRSLPAGLGLLYTASRTTQLSSRNDAAHRPKPRSSTPMSCVISGA